MIIIIIITIIVIIIVVILLYANSLQTNIEVTTARETKELKLDRYQERLDGFIGGIDVVTGKDSRFDENLKLEPMSIKILELVPAKIEEEKD